MKAKTRFSPCLEEWSKGTSSAIGALLLLTLGFLIHGCVATKIATIQQNIDLYKDQQISIRGTVTETLTVPGVKIGVYQIKDSSGQIWVVSSGQIPKRGETVQVKGTVSTGIEVLGKKFGTVIKQQL